VLLTGDTVRGVVTSQDQTFESKVLIDATEYGDVLPLTPARYRSGHGIGEDRQNACIQAITWTATIKKYPQGVPPELQMHTPPTGYDAWVTQFRRSMRADGNSVNRNLPVGLAMYADYRGVPDLSNPRNYAAMDSRQITRTSMNWLNDFDVTTALYDRSQRAKISCHAKAEEFTDGPSGPSARTRIRDSCGATCALGLLISQDLRRTSPAVLPGEKCPDTRGSRLLETMLSDREG
jgi:hypothetical protein